MSAANSEERSFVPMLTRSGGMRILISSLAGWARCFSSRHSCWLPCFCVMCCLAVLRPFVWACWMCGALAWVTALAGFPSLQAAQANCCCRSRDSPCCVCVGALPCCGNVRFTGRRPHVCSRVRYPSLKCRGWSFSEFPELVSVSCCLLYH